MTQTNKRRPATPRQASRHRAPIDALLDPALFKALADPTRASLLACLAKCGRACSVSEVAECCKVDFSVVSRHLALLARAGLLDTEKQGREVRYRVRFRDLAGTLRALASEFDACCPDRTATGGACCRA